MKREGRTEFAIHGILILVVIGLLMPRFAIPIGILVLALVIIAAIDTLARSSLPRNESPMLFCPTATIGSRASVAALRRVIQLVPDQPVIPILDGNGALCGLVVPASMERSADRDESTLPVAQVMVPPLSIPVGLNAGVARRLLAKARLPAVPIVDRSGVIIGILRQDPLRLTARASSRSNRSSPS